MSNVCACICLRPRPRCSTFRRYFVNLIMDINFFLDTIIQFNVAFFSEEEQCMITSRPVICRRFLRKWLIIDILGILRYDDIALSLVQRSTNPLPLMRRLKALRLLRLFQVRPVQRTQFWGQCEYAFSGCCFLRYLVHTAIGVCLAGLPANLAAL